MDMFFASIEIRDNPSLADKPVAVMNNNVVSTSNYVARRYGIKSSMPEFKAEKLCPELIFIPMNLEKYRIESQKIRNIFKDYDPNYDELGLDEAGLHVTNYLKRRSTATDAGKQFLASEIREKIYQRTQLTSSAGISCNKMLAKICSKVNKPNGQFYLKTENAKEFMKNIELGDIPGITQQESKLLKMLGVYTCADILKKKIQLHFGLSRIFFTNILKCALAIGPTDHEGNNRKDRRSLSISKSFEPTENVATIESKLAEVVDLIDFEMKKGKLKGKKIEVLVKTYAYENRFRREVTRAYFSTSEELYELALTCIRMLYPLEAIRNISIKVSYLKPYTKRPAAKQKPKNKYLTTEFETLFMNSTIRPEKKLDVTLTNSSLKISRYECEHCGKWLTGTENSMKFHKQICTGFLG